MKENELKQYYDVLTGAWKILRKHSEPTEEETFWESLLSDCHELYRKFPTNFCKNLGLLVADEVEKIYKKNNGGK